MLVNLTKFVHFWIIIIFAVSLHFTKLTLLYGAGDYEVVHSCGSSEVMHSACVCIFIRYILYFQIHSTLQVIVSSILVHSCENNEVMHSSYVYTVIRYTFRYWILPTVVGSTHLCTVVGMVVRHCILHEYQVAILSDIP